MNMILTHSFPLPCCYKLLGVLPLNWESHELGNEVMFNGTCMQSNINKHWYAYKVREVRDSIIM